MVSLFYRYASLTIFMFAIGSNVHCKNENASPSTQPSASKVPSTQTLPEASVSVLSLSQEAGLPMDAQALAVEASGSASTSVSTRVASTSALPTTRTETTSSINTEPTLDASPTATTKTFTCGEKGQPKCPLQAWMEANMQAAYTGTDPAKLASVLRASIKFAPPGYSNWAKYAQDGAAAVEKEGNIKAAKPSCKGCHNEYQKRYRTELRDRPI